MLSPIMIYCLEEYINKGGNIFLFGRKLFQAQCHPTALSFYGPLEIFIENAYYTNYNYLKDFQIKHLDKSKVVDYLDKSKVVDWLDMVDEYK
jgi:hypothetical protein